jgi:hypothetical protein
VGGLVVVGGFLFVFGVGVGFWWLLVLWWWVFCLVVGRVGGGVVFGVGLLVGWLVGGVFWFFVFVFGVVGVLCGVLCLVCECLF